MFFAFVRTCPALPCPHPPQRTPLSLICAVSKEYCCAKNGSGKAKADVGVEMKNKRKVGGIIRTKTEKREKL